jgi:hypothetical protein
MALYSIGRRTTGTTSGQAAMDLACSTGIRPKVMEVGFFLAAATASTYGLNRPTALGTRTSPVALLAEDSADPALTGIALIDSALAWSAQPTLAAEDLRRIALPATIGTGVIWTFPRGITLATSLSLALVNRATNGVGDAYFVAEA